MELIGSLMSCQCDRCFHKRSVGQPRGRSKNGRPFFHLGCLTLAGSNSGSDRSRPDWRRQTSYSQLTVSLSGRRLCPAIVNLNPSYRRYDPAHGSPFFRASFVVGGIASMFPPRIASVVARRVDNFPRACAAYRRGQKPVRTAFEPIRNGNKRYGANRCEYSARRIVRRAL
jgi:hypothetical protein